MATTLTGTYQELETLMAEFELNHAKHTLGNKAAGRRARTNLNEIRKLVTTYRKASVMKDKNG